MERLKLKLNSAESKDVFRALMELRSVYLICFFI